MVHQTLYMCVMMVAYLSGDSLLLYAKFNFRVILLMHNVGMLLRNILKYFEKNNFFKILSRVSFLNLALIYSSPYHPIVIFLVLNYWPVFPLQIGTNREKFTFFVQKLQSKFWITWLQNLLPKMKKFNFSYSSNESSDS